MPTLVLIRHGQSSWNLENRFTGWWDVDVTEKGAGEARAAGQLMKAKGLDFDQCYTSLQTRASPWHTRTSIVTNLSASSRSVLTGLESIRKIMH